MSSKNLSIYGILSTLTLVIGLVVHPMMQRPYDVSTNSSVRRTVPTHHEVSQGGSTRPHAVSDIMGGVIGSFTVSNQFLYTGVRELSLTSIGRGRKRVSFGTRAQCLVHILLNREDTMVDSVEL